MTSNKFIKGPLWATLVAALVTAMVAAFFVLVQSGEAAQVADEQPYEPKIIGGTAVPTGKYPFIAALIDTRIQGITPFDQQFCGGTLIDENSVLTAGHCVDDNLEAPGVQLSPTAPLRVTVGRTVLNSNQGQVRNVKRIFPHPNYQGSPTSSNYDAAVLELSRPVSGIQPIKLATSSQNSLERPGLNATVAGWGSTTARPACKPSNVPPAFPNRMREAQVPIVSDARAEQIYQDICLASGLRSQYTPPLMVAAGGTGKDTCQGDSGGPLFVAGAPDTQIGITSFGPGCGPRGYPGVYTEVNASPIASFIKRAAS
jgi:secreted trypsin-like serine protease